MSDSKACTTSVTSFPGEAEAREWELMLNFLTVNVFKVLFLKHVVSCHCFGSFVVEIKKRWSIQYLVITLITLQCLREFRMTEVFTLQAGKQMLGQA